MKTQTRWTTSAWLRPVLWSGLMLGSLVTAASAQLPMQESCSDMIQTHVDWVNKGLVGTNGAVAMYAGVIGTMSSHQLPNDTTSAVPDPVHYASGTTFQLDNKRNLVFLGTLQASPSFTVTPSLTVRITVTHIGTVTIQRLLNNSPYPLHPPDTFTATCSGSALTGYANGIQYTIGLQNTVGPENPI